MLSKPAINCRINLLLENVYCITITACLLPRRIASPTSHTVVTGEIYFHYDENGKQMEDLSCPQPQRRENTSAMNTTLFLLTRYFPDLTSS